jgi:hypothetical protein
MMNERNEISTIENEETKGEKRKLTKEEKQNLECTDFDNQYGIGLYHNKKERDLPVAKEDHLETEEDMNPSGSGSGSVGSLYRGLVLNRESEVLFEFLPMHTEAVATECLTEDTETISGLGIPEEERHNLLEHYDIYRATEGCLLRLFYLSDKWFLTTNRRLDAFQSRWSSKYSFGDMMVYTLRHLFPDKKDGVFKYFLSELDTSLSYVFMVRFNNDNRIVCRVHDMDASERLLFLGYFTSSVVSKPMEMAYDKFLDHPTLGRLGRQKPIDLSLITTASADISEITLTDISKYILTHIDPQESPGCILFHKKRNEQVKIVHPLYAYLATLRGNQSNLAIRYLELKKERDYILDHPDIRSFLQLYDRNQQLFQDIERGIEEVSKRINAWYTERYVKNRFISVPFAEYSVMKKCHQWYLQDVSNRRVYIRVVMDFLKRESPLFIYRMLLRNQSVKNGIKSHDPHNIHYKNMSSYPNPRLRILSRPSTPVSKQYVNNISNTNNINNINNINDSNNHGYHPHQSHPLHSSHLRHNNNHHHHQPQLHRLSDTIDYFFNQQQQQQQQQEHENSNQASVEVGEENV